MIEIRNLTYSYTQEGRNQLENINLDIDKGEFILLCGKSACGKTTALKCINGLIPHFTKGKYSGSVTVDGKLISDTPLYQISELVGSVFQNPRTQFFNLDSDSELVFGMENLGRDPKFMNERIDSVVKELEIEHLVDRNVLRLSGGEKQILAIASIYAVNPDTYVLDEPTANIDQKGIQELHDILKKLKSMGKTVIVAEHRLHFLTDLVDRAVLIENGRIKRIFTGDEFRNLPDEERIAYGLRSFVKEPERNMVPSKNRGKLEVRNLETGYGRKILIRNGSFSADDGDIIAVTGHNGVGKSTLIRTLCGLIRQKNGTISYEGKVLNRKQRQNICYLTMQDVVHQLFGDSVEEEFDLLNRDISPEDVTSMLKRLDLEEFRERHPMTLSGGQKQRLAIGVAAMTDRPIMLFDEPTSGLDHENMRKVSDLIRSISDGRIIFVVTHDTELERMVCNRKLVLSSDSIEAYDIV